MAESKKHTERVPVYFTPRQYADLLRCAARFDKKVGEYIRFGVCRDMYGSLGMAPAASNENDGASQGQEE
jgi:hypothetical protein